MSGGGDLILLLIAIFAMYYLLSNISCSNINEGFKCPTGIGDRYKCNGIQCDINSSSDDECASHLCALGDDGKTAYCKCPEGYWDVENTENSFDHYPLYSNGACCPANTAIVNGVCLYDCPPGQKKTVSKTGQGKCT